MNFKNRKLKKILTSSLVTASLFGSFGVGTLLGYSINDKTQISYDGSGLETSISKDGINIKSLSSTTLATGEMVKTFSYSVEPEGATNQDVILNIYWNKELSDSDFGFNKDVNDYVACSINKSEKIITVTCKQAFGTQIALDVISVDNPQAKATVTCDYKQKVALAFTLQTENSELINSVPRELYYKNEIVNENNYANDFHILINSNQSENLLEYNSNYLYNRGTTLDIFSYPSNYIAINSEINDIYTIQYDYKSVLTDLSTDLQFNTEAIELVYSLWSVLISTEDDLPTCFNTLYQWFSDRHEEIQSGSFVPEEGASNFITFRTFSNGDLGYMINSFNNALNSSYPNFSYNVNGHTWQFFDKNDTSYLINAFGTTVDTNINQYFERILSSSSPSIAFLRAIDAYYYFLSNIFISEIDIPDITDMYSNESLSLTFRVGYSNPLAEVLTDSDNILFND